MKSFRRLFKPILIMLSALLLSLSLPQTFAQSDHPGKTLPELMNMQTLGAEAKQKNLPIMLMFGAEWCEFCHQLTEEVLDPMVLSQSYEGKYLFMRHVGIDENPLIPDFQGKPTEKRVWADKLGADLTPTVIFVDGNGKEVAPRIVGIANIEFYPLLIHKNLNIAYQNMGNDLRIPVMFKN